MLLMKNTQSRKIKTGCLKRRRIYPKCALKDIIVWSLTSASQIKYAWAVRGWDQCWYQKWQISELVEIPHPYIHGMWSCWNSQLLLALTPFSKSILFWCTQTGAPLWLKVQVKCLFQAHHWLQPPTQTLTSAHKQAKDLCFLPQWSSLCINSHD